MPFSGRPSTFTGPRPQASERCAGHARSRRRARYTDDAAAERAAVCKNSDGRARALRRDAAQAARCRQSVALSLKIQAGASVAGNHGFEDLPVARAAPGAPHRAVAAGPRFQGIEALARVLVFSVLA